MTLYAQPNMTGGIDETLVQIARAVPSFIVGFLIFVFGVIFLGGSSTQGRRKGYSDYPMWAVVASTATLLISLILSLREGLIDILVLGVVLAVTIFSGLWFFLSRGRGEI